MRLLHISQDHIDGDNKGVETTASGMQYLYVREPSVNALPERDSHWPISVLCPA